MAEPARVRHSRLGSRPYLGALLPGYYTDDGKLICAGRVGTGMPDKVLADLRRRLDPLARKTPPLNVLPPRKTRFGSPLVLSRVHWVEPKLVAEITYLTWTADGCGANVGGRAKQAQELAADQAARAAFQISGAVLFLTRSLPSLN
jgi:ATP-dependent DNA ligase